MARIDELRLMTKVSHFRSKPLLMGQFLRTAEKMSE